MGYTRNSCRIHLRLVGYLTQNNESYHFTLGSIAALNAGGTAEIRLVNGSKFSIKIPITLSPQKLEVISLSDLLCSHLNYPYKQVGIQLYPYIAVLQNLPVLVVLVLTIIFYGLCK